jgi:hypothetical protein
MKKFLTMLMVASIFSLVACGPTEEEKVAAEAEAAAMVEEMMGGLEEVIDAPEEVAEETPIQYDADGNPMEATEEEATTEEEGDDHAEDEEHTH